MSVRVERGKERKRGRGGGKTKVMVLLKVRDMYEVDNRKEKFKIF